MKHVFILILVAPLWSILPGRIRTVSSPDHAIKLCTHPDYDALMDLYNSTDGANWTDNTGWVDGAAGTNCDPCSWSGVGCDAQNRVISLGLTNNNLSGTLPDLDLPFLERLTVPRNDNLGGSIPNFSKLPNLTEFKGYTCNFDGSIPDFEEVPLLRLIDINNNALTGNLPDFTNLPDLVELKFERNDLDGSIPDFANLPNLEKLHCSGNNLTGNLPDFDNVPSLSEFLCRNNLLSGCFPAYVCEIDNFDASQNDQLPWEGDPTNFCNGDDQIGAPCNDGDDGTTGEVIQSDCSCGLAPVLEPPMANLLAVPSTGSAPLEVYFNASNSTDADGTIVQYDFDFGNGNTSSNTTGMVNYTYTVEGTYLAVVTVTDNDGLTDMATVTITVEPAECAHPDYDALMELYNSTNGANWTDNSGWAEGAAGTDCDPCSWYGVRCNTQQRVATLDLEFNNLNGTIPDLNLPTLDTLDLARNSLSGSIPDFSNLPNLTILWVDFNNLSGSIPDFSNLPNLVSFWCYTNSLSGSIPDFSNLPNLKVLWCGRNNLTGNIPDFSNLPVLEVLYCEDNDLTGPIPEFSNISNLISFWCNDNNLSGCYPAFICDLASFIGSNNPLLPWEGDRTNFCNGDDQIGAPCNDGDAGTTGEKILTDCSCGIAPVLEPPVADLVATPTTGTAPLTVNFDATGSTDADGTIVQYDFDFGDGNTDSNTSGVESHTYTAAGTYTASVVVTDNDGLTHTATVTITVEVLEPPVADLVATPTTGTAPLTVNFDATGSTDADGTIVQYDFDFGDGNTASNSVGTETHVYTMAGTYTASLSVTDNDGLMDFTTIAITVEVEECAHPDYEALVDFYLDTGGSAWIDNSGWVDGAAGMDCDPCSWYGVGCNAQDRVISLSLADNNLSGGLPDLNLPFLERINFKNNDLSGSIPDFSNLSNLVFFISYNNRLDGPIPNFTSLPKLQEFRVNNNGFTGNLPDFSNLPDLRFLYIDGNDLDGNIPDFANLPNLEEFHCDRNNLDGSIPDFTNLPALVDFECKRNELSGPIPDFTNLPALTSFDCADNQLSGCFPAFVCDLTSFNATGNLQLPWEGDHTNYCNGEDQIGAICNDGDPGTADDVIHGDCSCASYEAVCGQIVPAVVPIPDVCDQQEGGATVTVGGGSGNEIYQWSAGVGNGNQVSGLASGTYSVTIIDGACEIIESFTVPNTADTVEGTYNDELCPGEQVVINGQTFDENNPSGTVLIPGGAASGCDSMVNVQLDFYDIAQSIIDTTLCAGETLTIAGTTYNEEVSNLLIDLPVSSINGCDSTVVLTLRYQGVLEAEVTTQPDSCNQLTGSASVAVSNNTGNVTYQWSNGLGTDSDISNVGAGSYTVTITDQSCTLTLPVTISDIQEIAAGTYTDELCPGEQVVINGQTFDADTPSGTVLIPGGAASGCDSMVTVELTFFEAAVVVVDTVLCAGETLTIAGTTYSEPVSGLVVNLPVAATNGCDSSLVLTLRFQEILEANVTTAADTCNYQTGKASIEVGNATGTVAYQWSDGLGTAREVSNMAAGDYTVTITDNGCPLVLPVTIPAVEGVVEHTYSEQLCSGEQVVIDGQVFDENNPDGTVLFPGGAANGCDSIVTVRLDFYAPAVGALDTTLCAGQSLTIDGETYSNPVSDTLILLENGKSATGCDSSLLLTLRYRAPLEADIETEAGLCDQPTGKATIQLNGGSANTRFQWSNGTESASNELADLAAGDYEVTITDGGCELIESFTIEQLDQLIEVDYTLPPLCPGEIVTVGGQTFDADNPSGTVQIPSATGDGCDSLVNVQLTFYQEVRGAIDTTLCAGQTLTIGGTVYDGPISNLVVDLPLLTANGCDSSIVLNLQFREASVIEQRDTICTGSSYSFYGRTLTESGTYEEVLPDELGGCDSTIRLELTVLDAYTEEIEQTICVGETYEFCGQMLTEPGAYTCSLSAVDGCDSIVNLQLWLEEAPALVAVPDAFSIDGTKDPVELDLLENDTLVEPYRWGLLGLPAHGSFVPSPDADVVLYQPERFFSGVDSFYYEVCAFDCAEVCDTTVVVLDVTSDCLDDLDFPTAFSPNNDGTNDLFDPLELLSPECEITREEVELVVINRLGEVIFSAPSYQPWNGRSATEGEVPSGTYFYFLRYRDREIRKPIMVVR